MSKKFLVAGSVNGKFDYLNQKIKQLLEKQNYDFLICVGSTLSIESDIYEYMCGQKKFYLKTYFIDSSELSQCLNQKYAQMTEICPNFFFLGRSGLQEIEGLKIAFINGIQSEKFNEFYSQSHVHKIGFSGPYFTLQDIQLLQEQTQKNDFQGVDILLSCQWPLNFDRSIKDIEQTKQIKNRSLYISQIADSICPRYHFVPGNEIFYQRQPYINQKKNITRLIGISDVGSKNKFLCAYQITPLNLMSSEELLTYTEDTTICPYGIQYSYQQKNIIQEEIQAEEALLEAENVDDQFKPIQLETAEIIQENQTLFVSGFDIYTRSDDIQDILSRWGQMDEFNLVYDERTRRHKGYGFIKFQSLKVAQQALNESGKYTLHGKKIYFSLKKEGDSNQNASCWFCFESQSIDSSLIFYEGKQIYLALDKGPITDMHFLIIPKDHISSFIQLPELIQQEVLELKNKMQKILLNNFGKSLICFERNMRLSHNISHMIFQCVPVQIQKLSSFKNNFEKGVKQQQIPFIQFQENEKIEDLVTKVEFYFYLECIFNGKTDRYIYVIDEQKNFPLDFGRQIICEILNIEKTNWKACQLQKNEIKQVVEQLKFQLNKQ